MLIFRSLSWGQVQRKTCVFIFHDKTQHDETSTFYDSIIMLSFGETKAAKKKISCCKKTYEIWKVNVDNIIIWKLIKTKINSFLVWLDF